MTAEFIPSASLCHQFRIDRTGVRTRHPFLGWHLSIWHVIGVKDGHEVWVTDIFFLIILMIAGDRRQQGVDGLFRVMRHERGVLLYKRLESVSGKGNKTRCVLMEGIDDTRSQPLPAFLSF